MFDLSSGIAKRKLRSLSRLLARFHITVMSQASTTRLEYLASARVSHERGQQDKQFLYDCTVEIEKV